MKSRTESEIKQRVQRRIIACSVLLMGGKFLAFALTNSVGILTDAMESIVNVIAGFISLYSLYRAAKPKDENHPFGHGKIELISASVEGLLIAVAGGIIIFEGVRRLFEPAGDRKTGYRYRTGSRGRSGQLPARPGTASARAADTIRSRWWPGAGTCNRTPIRRSAWSQACCCCT